MKSERLQEYLLQHLTDRNDVTLIVKDASEYFLAEDFPAVVCDDKSDSAIQESVGPTN